MNMACTFFGLTPEEALLGTTKNAAKALGLHAKTGTLEQANPAISRSGTPPSPPSSPIASASIRCTNGSGGEMSKPVVLHPGKVRLAELGGDLPAGSARQARCLLPQGRAGLGQDRRGCGGRKRGRLRRQHRLRQECAVQDLARGHGNAAAQSDPLALLRRRRCDARARIVRLMMALKINSLGRGASGVRPEVIAQLERLLAAGITPVVPQQGRSAPRAISRRLRI